YKKKTAEEKKADKSDKKEESVSVNSKVRNFYVDSVKANKGLRENRAEILACENLKEAQDLVLRLANSVGKKVEAKYDSEATKVTEATVKTASSVVERYRRSRL
nr:hypothetical protein [Candidatus Woesearchaeota archaeon]